MCLKHEKIISVRKNAQRKHKRTVFCQIRQKKAGKFRWLGVDKLKTAWYTGYVKWTAAILHDSQRFFPQQNSITEADKSVRSPILKDPDKNMRLYSMYNICACGMLIWKTTPVGAYFCVRRESSDNGPGGTEADAGFGLKHQTKYNAVFAAARSINIQCRFGFVKHVSPVRKHHPNAERADSKDSCAAAALYSHAWLHCTCGNRAVSRSRRAARQVLRCSAAHVCKILLMGGTY